MFRKQTSRLNTLKKEKKKNHTVTIQQKNKTYTILDPTLEQVIVRLQSRAAYIYTNNV